MGDVLVFAEHQAGHFPKTTLVAVQRRTSTWRKSAAAANAIAVIAGENLDGPAAELAKYG